MVLHSKWYMSLFKIRYMFMEAQTALHATKCAGLKTPILLCVWVVVDVGAGPVILMLFVFKVGAQWSAHSRV